MMAHRDATLAEAAVSMLQRMKLQNFESDEGMKSVAAKKSGKSRVNTSIGGYQRRKKKSNI
jgi:hypothetical protein